MPDSATGSTAPVCGAAPLPRGNPSLTPASKSPIPLGTPPNARASGPMGVGCTLRATCLARATSPRYTATTPSFGRALVPLAGDYNGDGVVDAADYTVWRDTLGSVTNLAADGNSDGMIDAGDVDVWRAHFGQTAGSGAAASNIAVPEPQSVSLLTLSSVGLIWICIRTRRVRAAPAEDQSRDAGYALRSARLLSTADDENRRPVLCI